MNRFLRVVFAVFACMCISFGPVVHAQAPEPPLPPAEAGYRFDQGRFETHSRLPGIEERPIVSADFPIASDNSILATSGPDEFGYTWDDTVPLVWIDASGGTTVGSSGYANSAPFGPIPLPFTFKFYENSYSQVNISQQGYITFSTENFQQTGIPYPITPNNRIAPYSTYFFLDAGSWVRYISGGSEPNRYFAVEWHDVLDQNYRENLFRFETIIYENGNILFQYQNMTYGSSGITCASAGIENSTGSDGLGYLSFCDPYPSYKAVLFTRPGLARVSVYPGQFGAFAGVNQTAEIQVPIRNTGELGTDIYDLALTSTWAGELYDAGGTTLLTDTDGDTQIDTGPIPQGGTVTVTVKFDPPALAAVGDDQIAWLNVTSSLDPSSSKLATLKTAIPAPFAQLYRDSDQPEISLALIHPIKNIELDIEPINDRYPSTVVEAPNGNFIYAWVQTRCLNTECNKAIVDVYYKILDHSGRTLVPATRLTNNTAATVTTLDVVPTIAVAPNGNIAILWDKLVIDPVAGNTTNLYFSILDSRGNLLKVPTNLTSETSSNIDFHHIRVAATGDNRFHLAWSKQTFTEPSNIDDVYFMAFESSGTLVRGLTKMTGDSSPLGYFTTELASLQNNRTILLSNSETSAGLQFTIFDSAGTVLSGPTNLTDDGMTTYEEAPAAVQLPNGKIFVAWRSNNTLRYAILNSNYQRIFGPASLDSSGLRYVNAPSVTTDAASRAIITWGDKDYYEGGVNNNLIYSLVDSSGTVLTQPMVFRSAGPGSSIDDGGIQADNTTFSWTPAAGVDAWVQADELVFGSPANSIPVTADFGNLGFTPTSSTVLQATVDPSLVVIGYTDTPVSQVGNVLTWNFADLDWLDSKDTTLWVSLPDGPKGTRYTIQWSITSAGSEGNPADNIFTTELIIQYPVYLPLIRR